jgi:hypothetical protein
MKRRLVTFAIFGLLTCGRAASGLEAVALRPTAGAPAGAKGSIEAFGADSLSLKTQGLRPGVYELRAVEKTEGDSVFLGLLSVSDPRLGPERQAGVDRQEDNSTHQSDLLESRSEVKLPPGVKPADVARIVVSDVSGNELLVAEMR